MLTEVAPHFHEKCNGRCSVVAFVCKARIFPRNTPLHASTAMPSIMTPSLNTAKASARAEQGLLGALGMPRLTVGKHPYIESQPGVRVYVNPLCTCATDGEEG